MGLKEDILNAEDGDVTSLEVPEWGTTVYIRQLSVGEVEKLAERMASPNGTASQRGLVLSMGLCDEDGNKLFGPADIPALSKKRFDVVDRVAQAIMRHNGMNPESAEALGKG